jgi:hypothetical protein
MMANFIDPRPGVGATGFTFGPDGNLYVAFANGNDIGSIGKYDGTTGNLIDANFVPPGSGIGSYIDGIAFGPEATSTLPTRTGAE